MIRTSEFYGLVGLKLTPSAEDDVFRRTNGTKGREDE